MVNLMPEAWKDQRIKELEEELRGISEGRGKLVISFEFLKEALHLPADAEIYGVLNDLATSQIEVYVKHSSLPVHYAGEVIPRVRLKLVTHRVVVDEITFEGWD